MNLFILLICATAVLTQEPGECDDPNAEIRPCGDPCPITCENMNLPQEPCPDICLVDQCACLEGYVLNNVGKCVSPGDCAPAMTCGANETYVSCENQCPQTCEIISSSEPQPPCLEIFPCPPGCDCMPGYVRDSTFQCISISDCPSTSTTQCPGENEEYQPCGGHCFHDEDCDSYVHGIIKGCPPPPQGEDTPTCYPRCVCKNGFVRVQDICILPTACCPRGTRLVECPAPCERNCTYVPSAACTEWCPQRKCVCADRYVRNGERCVPDNSCPAGCGGDLNAESKICGDPCPRTCENMDQPQRTCKASCIDNGCACKEGYVVDESLNGICVLPQNCPPKTCPGPNEVYSSCKDICPATCSSLTGIPSPDCLRPEVCYGGCNCADGFVRNANNECVDEDSCVCPDPNASLVTCPSFCPLRCDNLLTHASTPCPKICLRKGCACNRGYALNSDGNCVLITECPVPQCPANEEFIPCPGYCSFDYDCSFYLDGVVQSCPPPPIDEEDMPCYPRCGCKADYARNNGICVLPTECCPSPSTQLVDCPVPCERNCTFTPAATCTEICPLRKCVCAANYVRSGSVCIPENNCPCADPNAVFQYSPPPCPPSCQFPNGRTPCNVAGLARGCTCNTGFILDNISGRCVLPSSCPRACGVNEVFVPCKNPCPRTCASIISTAPPLACLPPNPCPGGCDCISGHVRNSAGACVPISSCPCPDRNAFVTTCPNPCPPTCDSPSGQLPCTRTCVAMGCTCRAGFVLSDIGGRCIRERFCPDNRLIDPRNQIQAASAGNSPNLPATSPTVPPSKTARKTTTAKPVKQTIPPAKTTRKATTTVKPVKQTKKPAQKSMASSMAFSFSSVD